MLSPVNPTKSQLININNLDSPQFKYIHTKTVCLEVHNI